MNAKQANGFTLIEVIVALLILSVGILALGASTGHVMAQIQASELRTERMTAVRQTAETLRATTWSALENTCSNAGDTFDTTNYDVSCSVSLTGSNLKEVEMITSGPGFVAGKFTTTVADTFVISIASPVN